MESEPEPHEEQHRLIKERIRKLEEIRSLGINPYPYKFDIKEKSAELLHKFKILQAEEHTQHVARIAGRIVSMRVMGKAAFMHIQDQEGKIQLYLREDSVPNYSLLKLLDLGDHIGVEGEVFKTKTGEITVQASHLILLSKSLRQLPEKFHGLRDQEIRYRQRYLDLIVNPEVRKTFILRSQAIQEMRAFLNERGFIEVETPTLQPIYGGANAKPFTTELHALNLPLYLKISDELYLKRLIVGGFDKVYEIDKDFRNEGIDRNHNPEFTALELYQAYADYNDMMQITEFMISSIVKKLTGNMKIDYQGYELNFRVPFERITMKEAIKKHADIDVDELSDDDLKELVETYNLDIRGELSRGAIISSLFEDLAQAKLMQPTFVYDYPKEISPLTKQHRKDPVLVERFELFINGWECANAYSELNDPIDQKERFEAQAKNRMLGDEEAQPMDEDFVEALEYGMPPVGGLGIGVDRIIMFITNSYSIRDVILFPFMKPEEK